MLFRSIGIEAVYEINHFAIEGFLPDLTLYFDVDPKIGLERIESNPDREINKLDLEGMAFHEKVREGYLKILHMYPERMVKIDANQYLDAVLSATIKEVERHI